MSPLEELRKLANEGGRLSSSGSSFSVQLPTSSALHNVVGDTLRHSTLKPKSGGSDRPWDTQSVVSERSLNSARSGASRVLEEAKAQRDARWEGYRSSFSGGSLLSRSPETEHRLLQESKSSYRSPWTPSTSASASTPDLLSRSFSSSRTPTIAEDQPTVDLSASTPSLSRLRYSFDSSIPENSPRSDAGSARNGYRSGDGGFRSSLFPSLGDRPKSSEKNTFSSQYTFSSSFSSTSLSRGGATGYSSGLGDSLNAADRASSIAEELRSLTSLASSLPEYPGERPSAAVQVSTNSYGFSVQVPSRPPAVPSLNLGSFGQGTSPGISKSPYESSVGGPTTARSPIDEGTTSSQSESPSPAQDKYKSWMTTLNKLPGSYQEQKQPSTTWETLNKLPGSYQEQKQPSTTWDGNYLEQKQPSTTWDFSFAQGATTTTTTSENQVPVDRFSSDTTSPVDRFSPDTYVTPRPAATSVSPQMETQSSLDVNLSPQTMSFLQFKQTTVTQPYGLSLDPVKPLYIGKPVQITADAACLEKYVKASGLTWPSGPSGRDWTWKLGKSGFVEKVDFEDSTVQISDGVGWTPIGSLVGYTNLSEEQMKQLERQFEEKDSRKVLQSDKPVMTPERKINPELEKVMDEASPANMVYYADCSLLTWSSHLENIKGLQLCRTKSLSDPVSVDSLEIVGWQTCVAGVDEGDGWLRVGNNYLPMELAGVPVLSANVYLLDNSVLKAKTRGLAYRASTVLSDKVGAYAIAPWGSLVHGNKVLDSAGCPWLEIHDRFLPFRLRDVNVLVRSAVAGAGTQQDFGYFEITVDNTNGSRLGLELDNQDNGSLLVSQIYGGLVLEWNCLHPDAMVAVGDSIIWVDDPNRDNRTSLLSKLQKRRRMTIRLERGST